MPTRCLQVRCEHLISAILDTNVGNEARYQIRIRPQWRNVEHIRSSVGSCVSAIVDDDDTRDAAAMVTAELLENAIKHGDPAREVDYLLTLSSAGLCIRVASCLRGDDGVGELIRMIDWIRSFESAIDAYQTRLQQIYQSDDQQQGGLGLVRIAYEGNCQLSVRQDTADYVIVEALLRPDVSGDQPPLH